MERRTFDDLVRLMETLRGPGGCPWDRQQKLADLKPFIIEEAYEVVDAIDQNDRDALREEIGDMLLEAVFAAEIARESGWFSIDDSITAIHDKLVRRHPHVFAGTIAEDAEAVLQNWEKLKNAERQEENKSLLAGVPAALPALLKAGRLTEKAARVGFDWERPEDIFAKIEEEVEELRAAVDSSDRTAIEHEIGDLLFTITNIARRLDVNAEEALQRSNRKFMSRFQSIEASLRAAGHSFEQTTLAELDHLWNEAKRQE
ncbi:MAG TPA: nucleoside triphosphate pyrophosphohydrolase [Thermoanaerobaculia bacterium]|nr:nucleoside triphosphate pyrophosphohydrolase [Thermoanaerobaculia bacterium]